MTRREGVGLRELLVHVRDAGSDPGRLNCWRRSAVVEREGEPGIHRRRAEAAGAARNGVLAEGGKLVNMWALEQRPGQEKRSAAGILLDRGRARQSNSQVKTRMQSESAGRRLALPGPQRVAAERQRSRLRTDKAGEQDWRANWLFDGPSIMARCAPYYAGKNENHGLHGYHGWERRKRDRTKGIEVATGLLLIRVIRVIRGCISCRRNKQGKGGARRTSGSRKRGCS